MSISEWPEPIGVIGGGAVGIALARAFIDVGCAFAGLGLRDLSHTIDPALPARSIDTVAEHARLIVLAVPDRAILSVAQSRKWRDDQWLVHCAGSHPAALLADAAASAMPGAFHPLASFARPTVTRPSVSPFIDRVIAIDGPELVIAGLRSLATRLGARPLVVSAEARAAYHLSASLASNAFVALIAEATDVWASAGLDHDLALPALLPLIASTLTNLETVGIPAALTGPIARGDVATVEQHLAVFMADLTLAPIAEVYRALGLRAVALSRAQGRAEKSSLDQIEQLLRKS